MEDLYNFILVLFFGMLIIYVIHPNPEVFYRNNKLDNCKIRDGGQKICIEE
jgi:hypothetical protein